MNILLVDDHVLFRDGLKYVLDSFSENNCILEASNADAASDLLKTHPDIDLILVDINMPGKSGFSVVEYAQAFHRTIPVIVLSGSEKREDMRLAIDLGAMGYIPKNSTSEVMVNALRLVASGEIYLPSQLANISAHDVSDSAIRFTPRQHQVLRMMVEGDSNKLIASNMQISEATIKMHITAIFKKLKVTNRTQAAMAAKDYV